jgi:hypothetical protein
VRAQAPAAAYKVVYRYPLVMVMKMTETQQVCDTKMKAKRRCYPPASPQGHMRMFRKALALERSK